MINANVSYRFLLSRRDGPVEHLTLNRPDVRNALNDEMIAELTTWADGLRGTPDVRAAVVSGSGAAFCAGADTKWFAKTAGYSSEENQRDADALGRLFVALDTVPVPLIGRVHGAALGGGAGLAAVCDLVIASDEAVFGFTEVKLGLVPAVISPFVLAKIGRSAARQLFLTGARFSAARALEIGLVHEVVAAARLDVAIARQVDEILSGAPQAIAEAKALIRTISDRTVEEALPIAAKSIASRRVSAEAKEGLQAFVDKRKPAWSKR